MEMLPHRYQEDRPWGSFERFTLNELSTVKILELKPGMELSLQRHANRAEFWRVLKGAGHATVGDEKRAVAVGDEVEIPMTVAHRLSAGPDGIVCLEIALGTFDEHDEERMEDDFGRTSP